MSNLITIPEATEKLGVSNSALCVSKMYKEFYHKATPGKYNARFDINGYMKKKNIMHELKAQVSLFTEYLVHERSWTYQKIADEVGVSMQSVGGISLGYKTSLKLAYTFKKKHKADFNAYHTYYNYKVA